MNYRQTVCDCSNFVVNIPVRSAGVRHALTDLCAPSRPHAIMTNFAKIANLEAQHRSGIVRPEVSVTLVLRAKGFL